MLAAIWCALLGWQTAEHLQARKVIHHMLIDRGRYITTTCGMLLGTGRFGVVTREHIEAALTELINVNTNELIAVELVNNAGDAVAASGPPIEMPARTDFDGGV